ncbi:expressed unknown protein [Seminavis robusta]|uniref:BTB domain-containing protein n=1 Tax=Seminavis robusta TaxID=568900 RepID=A0A9N8E8L3_9STRA|nr:expressed unknown protein [Seminavis robusta]|eukprot:Sro791_g203010.1 n/a (229) ;mRNA; r:36163-37073
MAEENAATIKNRQLPVAYCETPDEMLERFLTDDSLNDVILKGTDGVEVPANRFLLSARSDVFKGMLLGKFQEASSPAIELGFPGSVLKAVVEFVLTSSAQILNCKKRKVSGAEGIDVSIQQIESLVSLAEAASYFNLAGLGDLVLTSFETMLTMQPCLSFAALQACRMAGDGVLEVFMETSKAWVRETSAKPVSVKQVASLSKVIMEEILTDSETKMAEYSSEGRVGF